MPKTQPTHSLRSAARLAITASLGIAWAASLSAAAKTEMAPPPGQRPLYLAEQAKPGAQYPGQLRASEVCLRSLVPRKPQASSPYDTLQAIRDFHATRLEWIYGLTAEFVAQARALGVTVSGAAANNTLLGLDRTKPDWFLAFSIVNLNGEAVEAPWMRPWPGHALWHCVNNPQARVAYLAYVKSLVDLGVRDIQRDDPTMNLHATNWGACFCSFCLEGFRRYLQEHGDREQLARLGVHNLEAFDYAAYLRERQAPVGDAFARMPTDYLKAQFLRFQEEATIEFHRWWRAELNRYAGRYVPVSSNNGVWDFGPIHQLFDFYIGELSEEMAQPETLYEAMDRARALAKAQNVTMPLRRDPTVTPDWIRRIRQTLATCYALGMHMEAPWDTYLPIVAERPARYFGQPEESADLFGLVRACSELFDGYEEAAITGGLLDESPWTAETRPITIWAENDEIYAFTRAKPGSRETPIVVHLVDWSDDPQPFCVSLNPETLFAGRPFELSLLTPRPYDRAAHEAAEASHDYAPLVERRLRGCGALTTCTLPALRPWGLLVITPLPDKPALWPPRFIRLSQNGRETVALRPCQAGVEVRFTTDGTTPTARSPLFKTPLPLAGLKDLRARCFRGKEASAVAQISFFPQPARRWRELLLNADFVQGTRGWQPVIMAPLPPTALEFATGPIAAFGGALGALLKVRESDGVPYHLRLTQPVTIRAGQQLRLTATLAADRPTRVRFGLQERQAPFRVIAMRLLEIGEKPTRVFLRPPNGPEDLQAQLQLDLGYATAGTTIWLTGVQLQARAPTP